MTDMLLADQSEFLAWAPEVRSDALVRHFDNEIVAWSPAYPRPAHLDPVAALVFQMLDGRATIGELVTDVHDVVGAPTGVVRDQMRRVLAQLDQARLLTTSVAPARQAPEADDLDIFLGPPNP